MSSEYTLPPVPAPLSVSWYEQHARRYGELCADHVRAPLAEENARLLARLRSVCQTLVAAVGADGPCDAEDAAAKAVVRIAELEGIVDAYRNTRDEHLRVISKLRADAERWKWRKENPTARLVFAGGSWRVESHLTMAWHESADAAVDAAIAARKGEGTAMLDHIEPGDQVHHAPSGEDWVVMRVMGDRLEPAGWPRSQADLADCTLIRKGTPEQRQQMIDYVQRGEGE